MGGEQGDERNYLLSESQKIVHKSKYIYIYVYVYVDECVFAFIVKTVGNIMCLKTKQRDQITLYTCGINQSISQSTLVTRGTMIQIASLSR